MGWTIFFIVLAVLCLLLLLPVRVQFSLQGKKHWQIKVYYACFRLFAKSSEDSEKDVQETTTAEDTIINEDELLFIGSGDAPPITEETAQQPSSSPTQPAAEETADFSVAEEVEELTRKEPAKEKKSQKKGLLERVKPKGIGQWLELINDALDSLSPPMRFLFRHLYLRKLYVGMTIGTKDAAKTAILYGAVSGMIYRTLGRLQCYISVKAEAIRIRADFFNEYCTAQCSGELRISPMTALGLGFGIVIPFLWRTLWRVRRQEKQQRQEESESAPLPAA